MMDELFSCRNCIHNSGQSLLIGQGTEFCLQHESVIRDPGRTTCKYLHRKDLPYFVVDEGTREHAAEFAGFPFLASLDGRQSIERIRYSEINGSLVELNWPGLQRELATHRGEWTELIITSAKQHHEFFPPPDSEAWMGEAVEG